MDLSILSQKSQPRYMSVSQWEQFINELRKILAEDSDEGSDVSSASSHGRSSSDSYGVTFEED